MEMPRDIIYAEVFELLRNMDKEKVMKIPREILTEINDGRNRDITIEYDWNNGLNNEHFYPDTINILGYINYTYWAETEEEKEELRKIYNIPEKVIPKEVFFEPEKIPPQEAYMVVSEGKLFTETKETFFDKLKRFFKR